MRPRKKNLFATAFCTAIALLAMLVSGCASWTDRTTEKADDATLPKLKESPRSFIVNVEFVPIELNETTPDEIQSLWQWVDETKIDSTFRRELNANGIRVGRVLRDERFRSRLETMRVGEDALDEFLFQASVASDVSHGGQRIPMRLARRYELPVRQPLEGTHTILTQENGELLGRTLADPQFLLGVTPKSAASAQQVTLLLSPEVQHGSMRQKWVSSDSALRIDTRRDSWPLTDLDFELTGVENDTFVVGCIAKPKGLGKQMFTGKSSNDTQQQVLLLLTLAQVPTPADRL